MLHIHLNFAQSKNNCSYLLVKTSSVLSCDDLSWHELPHPPPVLHPPFIQGRRLISEPLSPAAICSSRTETRYLALCGRLEMELFIRPILSCLFCAGFIIASAMFGRQYLSLVSCAATCLLFRWRWAWVLAIYHPLRGAPWQRTQHPPPCRGDAGSKRWRKCQRISLQPSSHPVATPGLDELYEGGDVLAEPKRHTSLSLSDEVIELQSPSF